MEPVIGIVSCGFMNQRQFVPQTYIQTVEDAGGIPVVLPCTHDEGSYPRYGRLCDGFLFCGGDDVTPLLFGEELMTDRLSYRSISHILYEIYSVLEAPDPRRLPRYADP